MATRSRTIPAHLYPEALDRRVSFDDELLEKTQTTRGEEQWVVSVKQHALFDGRCDWGALLSSVPQALSHTGQCFIVASTPISASIALSGSTDMKYNSLRANLVHCSDLGRDAFREAEAKMNRLRNLTLGICEQNGIIDKLLDTVEDEILMQEELPLYLKKLKRISKICVEDAALIREKVRAWEEYASNIRKACEDQRQRAALGQLERGIEKGRKRNELVVKEQKSKDSRDLVVELERRVQTQGEAVQASGEALERGTLSDLGAGIMRSVVSTVGAAITFNWFSGSSSSKEQEVGKSHHSTRESRASTHKMNQELLRKAQEDLAMRRDAEMKAKQEFEELRIELKAIKREDLTVTKIMDIIQRCTNSLSLLVNQVNDLCSFFSKVEGFVKYIDDMYIDNVSIALDSAPKVLKNGSPEAREKRKKSLRLDALKLREYLQAAHFMAEAYVDISSKYIIPGVKEVAALSIPPTSEQWPAELGERVARLEQYADKARHDITILAQKRKDEIQRTNL